jgi:outer membrane protein assembly factor BamE (lipoprotein component of BamABCDE complex)
MPNFRLPNLPYRRLNLIYAAAFIFLFIIISCENPLPVIEGLNQIEWKEDKNGCLRKRASMISDLKEQKNKLQGLSESQVIKLLGRPDHNELYKRNQKFFSYFLQNGPACAIDSLTTIKLVVRFNAMGRAKEIAVE